MSHTKINTENKLSNFIGLDREILSKLLSKDYNVIHSLNYPEDILKDILTIREIRIPKKRGGHRIVYSAVSDNLANCLKTLNSKLSKMYSAPDCVHGFVKGRGIKTNAAQHLGKTYILKVDIEDYFENITEEEIIKALNDLKFSNKISPLIAHIVTHKKTLVQGFHTSPTLANIIFTDLDIVFSKYENITYTRYADDLYFSSDNKIDVIEKVEQVLDDYGFNINKDKVKYMKRGQKQYVTGLTVFDTEKPRISRHMKKKIRKIMFYIKKYGYKGHIMHEHRISNEDYLNDEDVKKEVDYKILELKSKIKGWLFFINSIEPDFAKRYINFKKSN